MGRLILISGPNGSGKSRFAEGLISRTAGPRWYIATMEPQTEEDRRRVERHRAQRAGLGFTTLELPLGVGEAAVEPSGVVLLEDVSNLLGNLMFQRGGDGEGAYEEICALCRRCALLVAVTISGLDAGDYEGETAGYIHALNALNGRLFRYAQAAAELENGVPRWRKGGPDAAD